MTVSITELLDSLGLWNVVFLILAILSIILSIYLHRKSQNISIPIFDSFSNILLQNKIKDDSDLKILYKGQVVERVTETNFAFWNEGRKVINSSDAGNPAVATSQLGTKKYETFAPAKGALSSNNNCLN